MTSITQEKTEHKLILRQQRKLTLRGFAFSVPGLLALFFPENQPVLWLVPICVLLFVLSIHSFYKGVSYTCTTDRNTQTVELMTKGLFSKKLQVWHFNDISLLLMGEKDLFLQRRSNCNYEILLDTVKGKRYKLLHFSSRDYCKKTIELMEEYFVQPAAPLLSGL